MSDQVPEVVLSDSLRAVAAVPYDRFGSRDQVVFGRLQQAATALKALVPGHYGVPISRGVGHLPVGLWVAVLDPDVTTTPTSGIYLVYLFSEDRSSVSLSLNQGVTTAAKRAHQLGIGQKKLLRSEAQRLRRILAERGNGLAEHVQLGLGGLLPAYEAGNVLARRYELDGLPPAEVLKEDLERFLDLYAFIVSAAEDRLRRGASDIALPPRSPDVEIPRVDVRFEPKDASDYRAHIAEHEQVRSRSHEVLLPRLADWSKARGYTPNNNVHPRDLVLHKAGQPDVLVEVKIFAAGRPRDAIRSAIGQLFEYREFFGSVDTRLLMCLPADPGGAYCELLTSLSISTIWPHGSSWRGTAGTRELGLLTD